MIAIPYGITPVEKRAVINSAERAGARKVYVDGGATISAFLAADLVDELTISVLPVILGDGAGGLVQGPRWPSAASVARWLSNLCCSVTS